MELENRVSSTYNSLKRLGAASLLSLYLLSSEADAKMINVGTINNRQQAEQAVANYASAKRKAWIHPRKTDSGTLYDIVVDMPEEKKREAKKPSDKKHDAYYITIEKDGSLKYEPTKRISKKENNLLGYTGKAIKGTGSAIKHLVTLPVHLIEGVIDFIQHAYKSVHGKKNTIPEDWIENVYIKAGNRYCREEGVPYIKWLSIAHQESHFRNMNGDLKYKNNYSETPWQIRKETQKDIFEKMKKNGYAGLPNELPADLKKHPILAARMSVFHYKDLVDYCNGNYEKAWAMWNGGRKNPNWQYAKKVKEKESILVDYLSNYEAKIRSKH